MKIYKRCYFTMIEILVAMGLAMGVLIALMGFYSYVAYIGKMGKDLEKKTFDTLYLQTRLSDLIPQSIPYYKSTKSRKKDQELETDYNFFTSNGNGSPSLTFLFENKTSNNSMFSGKSLGRVYVNEKKQLSFALFPSPMRWNTAGEVPVKIEILAEDVDSIKWSFFTPLEANRDEMWQDMKIPKNGKEGETKAPEYPPGQWVTEWKNDYLKLPPLVRLEIVKGKETTKFIFPLPMSEYMIIYE